MKRKKYKQREKKSKWTLIPVFMIGVVIVTVIAAVSYLGQLNQGHPSEPKYRVEEYFDILNPTLDWGEFRDNESRLIVRVMSFSLKAVGGNATNVVANHKGYYLGEHVDLGNIGKGEVRWVQLTFPEPGYLAKLEEKGYLIEIPIFCEEAWGDVTIYL